jgi:predicted alpha/beta superfamily hydrolase
MSGRLRIRVHYAIGGDTLVLRTSQDWKRDVAATETLPDGAVFELTLETPFVALKPCLVRDGELHWSIGNDYVLSAHDPDPMIWPAFFTHPRGTVSPLMHMEHEGRAYSVRVYTPPGYDETTLRTFPVLYMQDGKNLFMPEEAFGGTEWRVDETLDRLEEMNAVRKVIVVGIAPHDRMHDYTSPGYEAYGRFVATALKPEIDAKFRTRPDPRNTIVSGSSLGGVVSLFLAWQHSDVFGGAMCLSSTFGYKDDLFRRIAVEPKPRTRIYLDSGWPRDNFDATNAMRDLLVHRGFKLGDDLLAFSFPEGKHDELSWANRLHVPFQFFFGRAWNASRST